MTVFLSVLVLVLSVLSVSLMSRPKPQHRHPFLHDGAFTLVASEPGLLVHQVVLAPTAKPDCQANGHRVQQCTVAEGMAHIDVCFCGKQRYGRYGPWS